MKHRLLLGGFCTVLVLGTAFVPTWVLNSVPEAEGVRPHRIEYQETVACSGEISALSYREVYLETGVIPSRVVAEVGDQVEKGQVLVVIDTELTRSVISQGVTVQTAPEAGLGVLEELGEDYGLSGEKIQAVLGASPGYTGEKSAFIPREIFAPISGTVTAVSLSEGVLASGAAPAFVVTENDGYLMKAAVEEEKIGLVAVGDPAVVTGSAFDGSYRGVVTKIYPSARKSLSGVFTQTVVDVEIRIEDTSAPLRPGCSAKAVICTEEPQEVLSLTYDAIRQDEQNQEYVYVVSEGRVHRRNIVTGDEMLYYAHIINGLSEKDIVLLGDGLEEGSLVRVKRGERGEK